VEGATAHGASELQRREHVGAIPCHATAVCNEELVASDAGPLAELAVTDVFAVLQALRGTRRASAVATVKNVIRTAIRTDVPVLVELIGELAEYERAHDEVEIDDMMLERALFGPEPSAFAQVATVDDLIVGMALYYRSFSTWTGRPGIYLEDLYVRPAHRGLGIGRALLASLARLALDEDCRRLEWSVLDWNQPAIAFYHSIGAVATDEWTRYRLAGSALSDFASSL
jgi:GNAT superfamily N-acetyltransferase